ncbi:MAG: AraC family transcriptional regulator [Alcanivoracaceae bacterium]|nr:AraC family transcriptional regulator [Alcanivoracaceae bacterium]
MTDILLPASILPGLLEIALKGRLNIQALFEQAGIDADAVGSADHFIRIDQLDDLLSSAFAQAEDPCFGLTVGRDSHYGNMDLLGNLMATSDTLEQAIECLLLFKDLLVPYLTFEMSRDEHRCLLAVSSDESLQFTRTRTHNELVVATMVAIGRSLTGGELAIRAVRFRHSEPAQLALYQEFFAAPLTFDHWRNEMEMDPAALQVPLATAYPKYHQRLRRLAEQQLVSLSRASGLAGRVLSLLEQRLGQPEAGIESIAAALHMTPRTLQRHLAEEKVRFVDLRDRLRHQRACELLRQQELPFALIAEQLGFADVANFYHAFRRWEGCAPGEYRKVALSAPAQVTKHYSG